jgi:hypothetical protein
MRATRIPHAPASRSADWPRSSPLSASTSRGARGRRPSNAISPSTPKGTATRSPRSSPPPPATPRPASAPTPRSGSRRWSRRRAKPGPSGPANAASPTDQPARRRRVRARSDSVRGAVIDCRRSTAVGRPDRFVQPLRIDLGLPLDNLDRIKRVRRPQLRSRNLNPPRAAGHRATRRSVRLSRQLDAEVLPLRRERVPILLHDPDGKEEGGR